MMLWFGGVFEGDNLAEQMPTFVAVLPSARVSISANHDVCIERAHARNPDRFQRDHRGASGPQDLQVQWHFLIDASVFDVSFHSIQIFRRQFLARFNRVSLGLGITVAAINRELSLERSIAEIVREPGFSLGRLFSTGRNACDGERYDSKTCEGPACKFLQHHRHHHLNENLELREFS